jgi:hypothetical protein
MLFKKMLACLFVAGLALAGAQSARAQQKLVYTITNTPSGDKDGPPLKITVGNFPDGVWSGRDSKKGAYEMGFRFKTNGQGSFSFTCSTTAIEDDPDNSGQKVEYKYVYYVHGMCSEDFKFLYLTYDVVRGRAGPDFDRDKLTLYEGCKADYKCNE